MWIIRNLIFEGPGAYDVDGKDLLTNTGCTKLWVDHCEFYDGVDGNFDNSNSADNITISWCKFGYKKPPKSGGSGGSNDHRFSNLVGGSSSDYPADNRYSITFQYCYWADGCKQRMPRARNAQLHILNCYVNTSVSGSTAIGLEAGNKGTDCYVENSNYEKVAKVSDCSYGGTPNLTMKNCIKGTSGTAVTDKNGTTVSPPAYTYTALPVSQVKAAVTGSCGAGATLNVTAAGEISSPCSSPTSDEAIEINKATFIQTENQLLVRGVDVAYVVIYTSSGSIVSHQDNADINITFLSSGFYVAQITTNDGQVFSRKFIK
jgi:pectate lyase